MKNHGLSILQSSLIACALTIGSLASTQSAAAQGHTDLAEVNIPFAFHTTNQTLPAGQYRIERENSHLILLKGPANAAGFVAMNDTIATHPPTHGKLVFDRYGDKYYLRQVWTAGNQAGLECPKSRAEKQTLAAINKVAPESAEIAFNAVPTR